MRCAWDYGEQGQTFPCWTVAVDTEAPRVGIIHCEHGFGPKCPWDLVLLTEATPSMGMDSG